MLLNQADFNMFGEYIFDFISFLNICTYILHTYVYIKK